MNQTCRMIETYISVSKNRFHITKFCNILQHTCMRLIYHMIEADQSMKGTHSRSWCADTLWIASLCEWFKNCMEELTVYEFEFEYKSQAVGWSREIHRLQPWKGVRSPHNKCPRYNTKLYLIVRLLSWIFGECEVHFHCCYSRIHSDLEWWFLFNDLLWTI